MQNRYAGDIGDFVKLALLRELGAGRKLGVAWYLYPDEAHNSDGKHVSYLSDADRWRHLDPDLFEALRRVVQSERSVRQLELAGLLEARYHSAAIRSAELPAAQRCVWRSSWFAGVEQSLAGCDLVFADPDNGLVDDAPSRRRQRVFGKQMPLAEAKALAEGRTAIIYHHNTRYPGGHDAEVQAWLERLSPAIAIRANAYSCRTFFILNPDPEVEQRAASFVSRWSKYRVGLNRLAQVRGAQGEGC